MFKISNLKNEYIFINSGNFNQWFKTKFSPKTIPIESL